jgi:hypothetical protein
MQSTRDTTPYAIHHDRIIKNLDILDNLPTRVKSPKFVFAHLVVPHTPFVFTPDGKYVSNSQSNSPTNLDGYRNSVAFINRALLQLVDRLIAGSKTPPVIIIQGDHGGPYWNRPDQRIKNLNAYYLPGAEAALYPTITPVNSFRIVFNAYFGQDFPLLKDQSWYSPHANEYEFQLVPNTCGK